MADTIEQIRWKIWRAREKSEEADRLCEKWMSDLYTVRLEQDRQGRLVMRIGDVKPVPPDYILLIGEIANHLRSALDHLVFALAKPRTARQEQHVKFPLCSSRRRFDSQKKVALPGVPKGVLSRVESMQPYHRRRWPDTWLLGQIQAIDNWSKHRAIPITVASIERTSFSIRICGKTSITHQEVFRGRVESNKIITRLHVGESEVGARIYCDPILGLMSVFNKTMPSEVAGKGVRSILNGAGHFIQNEVLPRFERFF